MSAQPSPADALLDAAQRVIGLALVVHLHEPSAAPLAARWRRHQTACCLAVKRRHFRDCLAFDGVQVHHELRHQPRGRIHTCPFGMTEIAVPLTWHHRHCGVLFAGQHWGGKGGAPYPGLQRSPSKAFLQDRLMLLRGVAHELCVVLFQDAVEEPGRRQVILRFIHHHLAEPVGIDELAQAISLSPSRARHLVAELFGQPFTQLQRDARLGEATRLLTITDWPISDVAAAVGIPDQNYFARLFGKAYGQSPRAYRQGLDDLER